MEKKKYANSSWSFQSDGGNITLDKISKYLVCQMTCATGKKKKKQAGKGMRKVEGQNE